MTITERFEDTSDYTATLTNLPQPIKKELAKNLPMIQAAYVIGFDAGRRAEQRCLSTSDAPQLPHIP